MLILTVGFATLGVISLAILYYFYHQYSQRKRYPPDKLPPMAPIGIYENMMKTGYARIDHFHKVTTAI